MKSSRADAGFTLLELLVAMTVLGVLTGLLASGLGFGSRVWERERNQLDTTSDLQLVQDVLRRILTQALPLSAPADGWRCADGVICRQRNAVAFLGPPPAQSLAGGIYAYRLLRQAAADGTRLVLDWRLQPPQGSQRPHAGYQRSPRKSRTSARANMKWSCSTPGQRRVSLLRGVGRGRANATWRKEWRDATKLPQLVRLQDWLSAR